MRMILFMAGVVVIQWGSLRLGYLVILITATIITIMQNSCAVDTKIRPLVCKVC